MILALLFTAGVSQLYRRLGRQGRQHRTARTSARRVDTTMYEGNSAYRDGVDKLYRPQRGNPVVRFSSGSNTEPSRVIEPTRDFNTVFEAELTEVQKRRTILSQRHCQDSSFSCELPLQADLRGLALSGGGVRSATFCLGVVQALVKSGLFKEFDYLSTVSGGGYIGSTLSSSLITGDGKPYRYSDPPILRYEDVSVSETEEPYIIQRLRDYAKYLAPTGKSNVLTLPALVFLGFMINSLLILPALILCSLAVKATSILAKFPHPTVITIAIFSLWAAIYSVVVSNTAKAENQSAGRQKWLNGTVRLASILVIFIFISLQPDAVDLVKRILDTDLQEAISWLLGSLGAIGVLFGVIGYIMNKFGRLVSRLWRVALGLSAPAILWFVVLSIVSTLYYPCSWNAFETATGLHIANTFRNFADNHRYVNLDYGAYCHIHDQPDMILIHSRDLYTVVIFYIIVSILLVSLGFLVNVNATSLHTFYRDRLRDAYIIRRKSTGELKLSQLSPTAPYHILNAAINIQSSSQNLRGRDAQVFYFSKLYCGSKITGWCPTMLLERADPQIDLAAAVAISGAAVAPNQGVVTNRPLRFLMAIANARLGYWLINPARLSSKILVSRKVSPYFFVLEFLGRLDETRRRIYVSDGGHIENLGVYELLRRRCKYIVIVDAEQDTSGSFHGLAHLTRIAKINFDYDIEISMPDIRPNEAGLSKAHSALGFVRYSASEVGNILYIKASLTGDENEYITEYRKRVKVFPHESTTDQFFTEEQFEAYRALGFHIAEKLTLGHIGGITKFFDHLREILVIDVMDRDAYLQIQRKINRIETRKIKQCNYHPGDPKYVDVNDYITMRQKLNIMEFGVLKLNLNQAYIANGPCKNIVSVFTKWIRDIRFREFFQRHADVYGDELRRFVQESSSLSEPVTRQRVQSDQAQVK
jgi:hypothetical protein